MMPRTPEAHMRVFVLFAYTVAALAVVWSIHESAWAVLHLTGALAGACAASLAITYAGLIGEATPGGGRDQGEAYMERMEDWDD